MLRHRDGALIRFDDLHTDDLSATLAEGNGLAPLGLFLGSTSLKTISQIVANGRPD